MMESKPKNESNKDSEEKKKELLTSKRPLKPGQQLLTD